MTAYAGIRADGPDRAAFIPTVDYRPGNFNVANLDVKGTPQRRARRAYAYILTVTYYGLPVGTTRVPCFHCGQTLQTWRADVDHVTTRANGAELNVMLLHVGCNRGRKRDHVSAKTRKVADRLRTVGASVRVPINAVAQQWREDGIV